MQKLPQLRDVSSDQQSAAPAANLIIDRDAAGRFGITPADIDAALYNQIGQRQVAQYFTQLNSYRVIMEAPPELQASPELFNRSHLISPRTGKPVPLSALVKVDSTATRSLSIAHQGQFPATTLSFNLAPGVSLGDATAAVEQARADLGAPPTLSGSFQGTAQAFQAVAVERADPDPGRAAVGLCDPGRALRELHPSADHPLDPALGRSRARCWRCASAGPRPRT